MTRPHSNRRHRPRLTLRLSLVDYLLTGMKTPRERNPYTSETLHTVGAEAGAVAQLGFRDERWFRVGARRLIVLLNESEESKAGADGGSGWREVTHRGGRRCVVATTGRLRQRNLTSPYASAIPVSAFAQTLTE
uniref:Uncharacterized protein n=1 Tax=Mycena chlorophos TaxID=658473 RepID=A0ABQ0LIF1_MYCCL|nr:predicted protein [Mycena chlorophos]